VNKPSASLFAEFIEFFPPLVLPLSLLPDIRQIPSDSLPLPLAMLEEFILPLEGSEADEYTEYIPYGHLINIGDFYAVIYWKAGVMRYEYVLATYDKEGTVISHAIIGGMRSDEEGMLHSVAVIKEDKTITIAEGFYPDKAVHNGDQTNTYEMNIDSSGQINYDIDEGSEEA
jgi:hypothetical protein